METGVPVMGRKRSEWSQESACSAFPRLFTGDESKGRMELTRPICGNCPVGQLNGTGECIRYAVAHDMYGIWDGTTTRARKAIEKDQKDQMIALVPEIEPSFQSYLKKEEPVLLQKPKKITFPIGPPKVLEKPKFDNLPQTPPKYQGVDSKVALVRMVESPVEQVHILDQLLLGLQSLSSPAKLSAV
jgi:hypothetical protein